MIKKFSSISIIILFLIIFAGCSASESIHTLPTVSPVPTQALEEGGETTSITPTETLLPNLTDTLTGTVGQMFTPTPTPLPVQAKYKLEDDVLKFYGGDIIDINLTESALKEYELDKDEVVSVIISEGIKEIGFGAFDYWLNLSEVFFPDSLQIIGERAFSNCAIVSLEIPDSVKVIEDGAFLSCSELQYVKLPIGLMVIEEDVFCSCRSLCNVEIPNGVEEIKDRAFASGNDDSLCIKIPDSVLYIDMDAFERTNSITIYCNTGSYAEAYAIAKGYAYESGRKTNIVMEYDEDTHILNFSGEGVLTEDDIDNAWKEYGIYYSNVKKVILGEGIIGVGPETFRNWKIICIDLPKSLVVIGDSAFENCHNILFESDYLPENLLIIGSNAFFNCDISTIGIPEGVRGIGEFAFSYCENLDAIKMPDSLREISYHVFDESENLVIQCNAGTYAQEYAIENNIVCVQSVPDTYIKKNYFFEKDTLTCFGIGSILRKTVAKAVEEYNILDEKIKVEIQDGILEIADSAFDGLSNLVSIHIPDSVRNIKQGAFAECTSLESIQLPEHISVLSDYLFSECTGLSSFVMSDNVKEIGRNTFRGCVNLQEIYFSENLERIYANAFEGCCELRDIYLPESIIYIDSTAFLNCENLVIHGKEGSEAIFFARIYGIDYILE